MDAAEFVPSAAVLAEGGEWVEGCGGEGHLFFLGGGGIVVGWVGWLGLKNEGGRGN